MLLAAAVMAVASVSTPLDAGAESIPDERGPGRSLVTALHVHSTWSTGSLTLDELAERAARLGIEAIVLADNFALRYEYGLPPLRGGLRIRVTVPSVSASEAEAYLEEITAAQARHPGVLLIPGIEVAPYYYWTGSLLRGDLRLHDSQRNLLVLGLRASEDYASLPATGNAAAHGYGWRSLANASPALLVIAAVWLWGQGRGHRRPKRLALTMGLGGALLLANAWPFSQPAFSPYDADLGYAPYQALIDAAMERGGVVLWSLPEARDHNEYPIGPLGRVTVQTAPHPEALLETAGYTGFGGLYQDTRHVADPGGVWDRTLEQVVAGRRPAFPVLLGEIAFHRPGQAGIELHQVLNVLRVRERSVEGVVEALRQGRLYAVGQYPHGPALRLTRFAVEDLRHGGQGEAGAPLAVTEPTTLRVDVEIQAADGGAYPVSVTLVRSGAVVAATDGETPLRYQHFEKIENPGKARFYRVEVKGRQAEILSNPIFVWPSVPGS